VKFAAAMSAGLEPGAFRRDKCANEIVLVSARASNGVMRASSKLVPSFTEARVNQFLGFRSQMSHLPAISDTRAPAILGTRAFPLRSRTMRTTLGSRSTVRIVLVVLDGSPKFD
jgi:hypothetical protein